MNKTTKWHLAQLNVGKMTGASIDDPAMAGFVALLDEINTVAEASKGFIWRLKDENNNATSLNPFGDERILVNMSVWETVDDLEAYVYSGRHLDVLKSRRDWFVKFGKPFMALWYIAAGHIPTVEEARERLDHLQRNGPTAYVFDFNVRFAAPAEE
ncbi:MAG TPA: DUF3291 domain-containing protein [Puia sp.]|nr:DUF3291 domain-containing protein [Puia sp.]